MAKAIRIAVIGLGWVALHRHIPAIRRNPDFELVGIIDRHAGHAEKVARKLNLKLHTQTDSLDAVPWLDEIDALAIASAPFSHASLATSAMARGKHVLCEKPFAMNVAEGESMLAAAQTHKRVLAVMHNFQFSRCALRLNRDLANGRIGAVRRIRAVQLGNPRRRLPSWYEQLPLGLFYDESPHFFYLLRHIAGEQLKLQHAHGIQSTQGHETPDAISLLYRNVDNIPATIDCQFDSSLSEWFVMVSGEKQTAILDIFRDIYIRLPNDEAHGLKNILRTSARTFAQHLYQHIPNGLDYLRGHLDYGNNIVFDRFAAAIHTGISPRSISGADALAVLKMQHEATDAIKRNMLS